MTSISSPIKSDSPVLHFTKQQAYINSACLDSQTPVLKFKLKFSKWAMLF